ncbi:MAG: HAMP domain-containing sensor histidine kinase [Eubacteriales bacterium]|nr:HAMP domain-containing sensor histidine kinase [Eubacteriales bacterium]
MIKSVKRVFTSRTVFKRFVFLSFCVCVICLVVSYGIFTLPVNRYIKENRQDTLEGYSAELAKYIGTAAQDDITSIDENSLNLFIASLDAFANSMHATVIITDSQGKFCYSNETDFTDGDYVLSHDVLERFREGDYSAEGVLRENFTKKYYISAAPITLENKGEKVIGYCIVSQTNLWAPDYVPSISVVFVTVALITIASVVILSSVFAYNTSIPLKQMSDAARRFAVGDFESRVQVKRNDEIGQLAKAFNEMADSLAASEGVRRNFVANVSHELKTPMTTIAGYIDGILDGTIPASEQEYYLGVVSGEVKRLSRLVTSMISLSKIDSGEIRVQKAEFEVKSVIFDVLLSFEKDIFQKKIAVLGLEDEEDVIAYGDRDLIYQVIFNLVENAVKFTPENGYIRFDVSRRQGKFFLSVENSGKGILPEDINMVFDKFYKGDKSRSTHKNSMGLGLYIAKIIVNLHEGRITAESEPDKFCRFTFWLPELTRRIVQNSANKEENSGE